MKTLTKTLLLSAILGMVSFSTCVQAASDDATSAVTCDKCKTVWVKRPVQVGPSGKGATYYALKSEKSMECPDCQSAIATFFKTGKLKHECAKCGGTMTHCTNH